jgi:hypothetical protein
MSETRVPQIDEWWLMSSALPDLVWARLRIHEDQSAEVLEASGKRTFANRDDAESYLAEDEYSPVEDLIEDDDELLRERFGQSLKRLVPPAADSDPELVEKLVQPSREQPDSE